MNNDLLQNLLNSSLHERLKIIESIISMEYNNEAELSNSDENEIIQSQGYYN
jgi:hypothetical protein